MAAPAPNKPRSWGRSGAPAKTALARLLVTDVYGSHANVLKANGHGQVCGVFEATLDAAAKHAFHPSELAAPLNDFLRRAASKLDAATTPLRAKPDPLAQLFQEIDQRIAAFITNDEDPFQELWDRALPAVIAFYDTSGIDITAATTPVFRLRLHRNGPLHPLNAPHAIFANVERVGSQTVVVLSVAAEDFDRRSYCAVAYALLHELIVHVFSSVRNSVPWHEGWMDAVAHEVHDVMVRGGPPIGGSALPDQASFIRAGGDFHAARLDAPRPGAESSLARYERATGDEAAERFREKLRILAVGDDDAARDALWRFSAALNTAPGLTGPECDRVAGEVHRLFDDRRQSFSAAQELEAALKVCIAALDAATTTAAAHAAVIAFAGEAMRLSP